MMLSDYTELNEEIHAPKELKDRVLLVAVQNGGKMKKGKGHYSRGWSVLQKAAAVAILVVCLPVTAYAAVKRFGLMDYLSQRGMEELLGAEQLVITPSELYVDATEGTVAETDSEDGAVYYSTKYAKYTILEAICDSQTIYLAAQVKPLGDYFLIPQYLSPEDSVANLTGLEYLYDENPGMTIGEYAASKGKNVAYAGVGYKVNQNGEEVPMTGGEEYRYDADGTLYYYFTTQNISGSDEFTLKCTGNGYEQGAGIEEIERVAFDVKIASKSNDAADTVYTSIDPEVKEETGIQVHSLTLAETEMGLYATFRYSITEAKFEDIFFKLVDPNGEDLSSLPGTSGTGSISNGDGTFSCTVNYQKPASLDGLQFMIRDLGNSVNYGPYSFE